MRGTGPGLNFFLTRNLTGREDNPVSTMGLSGHSPHHPSTFVLSVDLLPLVAPTRNYLSMYWLHMEVYRTNIVYTTFQLVLMNQTLKCPRTLSVLGNEVWL